MNEKKLYMVPLEPPDVNRRTDDFDHFDRCKTDANASVGDALGCPKFLRIYIDVSISCDSMGTVAIGIGHFAAACGVCYAFSCRYR
jgi:hypothetical protein